MSSASSLLQRWVLRQSSDEGRPWLRTALQQVAEDPTPTSLYRSIGFCSRRLGRDPMRLSDDDVRQADNARPGWRPDRWTLDAAGRVALLLQLPQPPGDFFKTFETLCRMGEMQELVAYYGGLPLYPDPARYRARAAEGLRTNMQVVFEAVAHRNPYPAEQLDEGPWNQMVLKALFIGSALHPIQGLERRANLRLTRMLCDYARERWAASRSISPELWRCVGAAADAHALEHIQRALSSQDTPGQQQAAALALHGAGSAAAGLLDAAPDLKKRIDDGSLTWASLTSALQE